MTANGKVDTLQFASLENPAPVVAADSPATPEAQESPQKANGEQGNADDAASAKERSLAERMAFLRRKEVAARKAEFEAKSRTEGLEAKLKDLEAKAQRADRIRELVGSNPLVALEELGISEEGRKAFYEAMTREFVENKSPYEAHKRLEMDQGLKTLEEKIATLQKELTEEREQAKERQAIRMATDALEEISSFLKTDESYELTASHGRNGAQTVLEVAKILAKDKRKAFKGNAEEFSRAIMKEAADKVESHFETEALRLASLKKMKAKLGIKDSSSELKTLTNALNGSPVVPKKTNSDDDLIDEAVRQFRLAGKR